MIIYNFYDFGFGNFCPNNSLVRFCAPNNQSVWLIKVTCPLALAVAYEFMEMSRKRRQSGKIFS